LKQSAFIAQVQFRGEVSPTRCTLRQTASPKYDGMLCFVVVKVNHIKMQVHSRLMSKKGDRFWKAGIYPANLPIS